MLITHKQLIYSILILSACILLSLKSTAQEEPPQPPKQWTLQLGGGMGYISYRDRGTAPFHFRGVLAQPLVGVQLETLLWRYRLNFQAAAGICEDSPMPILNFSAFDVNNTTQFSILRRLPVGNLWRFWAGAGIENFLDVTINPDYENSAVGVSEFVGPLLLARTEWQFHRRWNLYGEASFMPMAALLRPGYSYIDNYTAYQPVLSAQFSSYQWNLHGAAAMSTELGVDFQMGSGNQLSLSYLWRFHGSGNSGYWNFDHSFHLLIATLTVKLN